MTTATATPTAATDLSPALGVRERNYVFSVAMKYVKNEVEAEDVTQEALLLAHRHQNSFRGDSRYSTWLYRVAATTALMHLRSKRRRAAEILAPAPRGSDDGPSLLERRDPAPSPADRAEAREKLAEVAEAVERMGKNYRKLFWMRYRDGYTEPQIAERLGLPVTTVKTRSFRARRAVLQELEAVAEPLAA